MGHLYILYASHSERQAKYFRWRIFFLCLTSRYSKMKGLISPTCNFHEPNKFCKCYHIFWNDYLGRDFRPWNLSLLKWISEIAKWFFLPSSNRVSLNFVLINSTLVYSTFWLTWLNVWLIVTRVLLLFYVNQFEIHPKNMT